MTEQEFLNKINSRCFKNGLYRLRQTYCREFNYNELFQEVILNIWKGLGSFRKSCKFETWAFAIAKYTCISLSRKQKKIPNIEGLTEYIEIIICEDYNEELIRQLEIAAKYNTVINSVDEEYKDIFIQYLEGVSFRDLSQRTGINENNLRVKIHRIKRRLQLRYGK